MLSDRRFSASLVVSLLATALLTYQISQRFHDSFPPFTVSLSNPAASLEDFIGVIGGFHRLTADWAWIQTLQYYGTPEAGQSETEIENGLGHYPLFFALCERVIQIDPYFTYAYYYGSAVLGWNLNRLDEAEKLLKEGISRNPKEWRLSQYLAALAYQRNHDVNNLTKFLEAITQDPDCPSLLKALLANIYKKQHNYYKALKLWLNVYDSGDPSYRPRAEQQIRLLDPLVRHPA